MERGESSVQPVQKRSSLVRPMAGGGGKRTDESLGGEASFVDPAEGTERASEKGRTLAEIIDNVKANTAARTREAIAARERAAREKLNNG